MKELEEALEQEREAHSRVSCLSTSYAVDFTLSAAAGSAAR